MRHFSLFAVVLVLAGGTLPAANGFYRSEFFGGATSIQVNPGAIYDFRLTPSTGVIELHLTIGYEKWINQLDSRVSADLAIQSGGLLGAGFYAPVSAGEHVRGQMQCISGVGTQWGSAAGLLSRYVRVQDLTTAQTIGEYAFPGYVGCTGTQFSPINYDAAHSLTTPPIFFAAGHNYRFDVGAKLFGSSEGKGSFYSDFYDDGDSRRVDFSHVEVPTPPPIAQTDAGPDRWFAYNLLFGTPIVGRACHYEEVTSAGIEILQSTYANPSGMALSTPAGCTSGTLTTRFLWPQTFTVRTYAAASGGSTNAWDSVTMTLLPTSAYAINPLMPNLDVISNESVGPIRLRLGVSADGAIVGGTLDQAGILLSATSLADAVHVSDHVLEVQYLPVDGTAQVIVDGVLEWSGPVVQVGPEWWDIVPADAVG